MEGVRAAKARDPARTVKEDLRRRCLVRAAAQRQALLSQHRQASVAISMASIVAEELRSVRAGGEAARPSAWSEEDEALLQAQLGREAYLELMAATEETLLRELDQEASMACGSSEWSMAEDYEEYLTAEDALIAQLDGETTPPLDGGSTGVLCPLCVRAPLTLTADGCVKCSAAGDGCALQLDAKGHPAPIDLLRERMDALLREHGQRCNGPPCCRLPLPAERPLGMLLFCCHVCGVVTGVV